VGANHRPPDGLDDFGVTVVLIEKGIEASLIPHGSSDRPPEEIVQIVRDHHDALDGPFSFVKQHRPLSSSYICELHSQMQKHQESTMGQNSLGGLVEIKLVRGKYKMLPNNPSIPGKGLHEYCPPEHVASEMDNLIAWHLGHTEQKVPAEIEAAWLHHRFTQIHPFQDGNGRIARALASLVFIREGYFPLLITRDTRAEYIDALGIADTGDIGPLILLFARLQRGSLVKALSLSEDVMRRTDNLRNVIRAAVERLGQRRADVAQEQKQVYTLARGLETACFDVCRNTASILSDQLRQVDTAYRATADRSVPDTSFWFKSQIVQAAKRLDYFADTLTYRTWVRLKIAAERQAVLVFSFHSIGTRFVGILGVSAFVEFRDIADTEQTVPDGPYLASDGFFEFSYMDNEANLKDRFTRWLDDALAMGLDQWRRQI